VDLTKIPGIRAGIAQMLFGEIGPDFTKFRSASAFASWMGLCPDNDISGGKVLWVGTRKVKCRAATSLRMVWMIFWRSLFVSWTLRKFSANGRPRLQSQSGAT
jgi:transposase